MIGLSGFKSRNFIFINSASKLWFCRDQTGRAVQLPPRSPEYVVYIIGHIAGEYRFIAVLEADGGTVDLHHINDFYGRHRNRFNSRDIEEFPAQTRLCAFRIHCNGGFAAEEISVLRLQHKGIHITLSAFKFRDGRK